MIQIQRQYNSKEKLFLTDRYIERHHNSKEKLFLAIVIFDINVFEYKVLGLLWAYQSWLGM